MSYESIASSVSTSLRSHLREIPSRLISPFKRALKRRRSEKDAQDEPTVSSEIRERATILVESYARENDTLFDRIDRWNERVERLQSEGASSESAENRAGRARQEALEGLRRVRNKFVSENGKEAAHAFDAELLRLFPELISETED